jgi:3',5'-cyclic AMP phosphodiesterase CpdA
MSTITWLHLSDLHFRTGQQHAWDEDIVLRALLNDVREAGLRPDFIVVSGDIAFGGRADEYTLAGEFLNKLLEITQVPKLRLFIVPGNHDVNRSAITPGANAIAFTLTSHASLDQILITPEDRGLVFRRLGHYADFVKDFFGEERRFDDEHYFYVEQIQVAGQRIALLGLDTAWLSAGDNDRGRLALSERQIREALKASQDADWRIALLHHPFDWLLEFDQNNCEDLLMEGCRFILHGHLHRTGLLNLKTPDAGAMIIAAGASYETRQSANSYNWVRLDVETGRGTIYLRTYSDRRGGFWTKDTLTYKNASNGEFTFTLPASEKKIGSPQEDTASRAKTMVSTPVVEETARHAALNRYLKNLQRICNALPLAALSDDADVHRRADITLDRVYIALDTTTRVPLTDVEKKQRKERFGVGREEDRALPVLQAANQNARLVIIGDPGSGKSSFVNNLSVLLAGARLKPTSLPAMWSHGALLPVRVLLRELAPTLPDEKDLARLSADQRERALCDAVRDHISKIVDKTFEAGLAAPLILDAIAAGECLIIFDGLDEVSPERRRLTRETVETFATHYRDNRFLVTCRVRSYQNDARLPSFVDVTLAPFDEEKINNFVRAWYIAQADLGLMPRERADARAEDLQEAVARLNELAQTPLLLTTMAVVHTAQVELPRERAVLYQRCVELLLRRWHKHKQGESALLVELGLSEAGLLEALWAVAFEAHARGKPGQAADLPKSDVIKILAKKMGNYANAEHFLEHVDERAGLLVGRGGADESEPVYTFPHRTFQEFLAGTRRPAPGCCTHPSPACGGRAGDGGWFAGYFVVRNPGRRVHNGHTRKRYSWVDQKIRWRRIVLQVGNTPARRKKYHTRVPHRQISGDERAVQRVCASGRLRQRAVLARSDCTQILERWKVQRTIRKRMACRRVSI